MNEYFRYSLLIAFTAIITWFAVNTYRNAIDNDKAPRTTDTITCFEANNTKTTVGECIRLSEQNRVIRYYQQQPQQVQYRYVQPPIQIERPVNTNCMSNGFGGMNCSSF